MLKQFRAFMVCSITTKCPRATNDYQRLLSIIPPPPTFLWLTVQRKSNYSAGRWHTLIHTSTWWISHSWFIWSEHFTICPSFSLNVTGSVGIVDNNSWLTETHKRNACSAMRCAGFKNFKSSRRGGGGEWLATIICVCVLTRVHPGFFFFPRYVFFYEIYL